MADEFSEAVPPVTGGAPVPGPMGREAAGARERLGRSITGRIVEVRRRNLHQGGGHSFDVSVGAESFTEIVLRVPDGAYADVEGKRGVLYVDE